MNKEEIIDRANEEIDHLLDEERTLAYLITEYGTGSESVLAYHLDDSFKKIKRSLKNVRSLAMRLNKLNDGESDQDGKQSVEAE